MLSDVLSDAVADIDRWRKKKNYKGLEQEIEVVRTLMESLRMYLDAEVNPTLSKELESLAIAIRQVEVKAVVTAQRKLIRAAQRTGKGKSGQ